MALWSRMLSESLSRLSRRGSIEFPVLLDFTHSPNVLTMDRTRNLVDVDEHRTIVSTPVPKLEIVDPKSAKSFLQNLMPEERKLLYDVLRKRRVEQHYEEELKTPAEVHHDDLVSLWWINFIPFMVYGCMDNIVMIVAGETFDKAIGLYMGISIMAAAAIGNIASNVMGIGMVHYVEVLVKNFGIRNPYLSIKQMNAWPVRMVTYVSRVFGLVCGCVLGMAALLFYDAPVRPIPFSFDDAENEQMNTDLEIKENSPARVFALDMQPRTESETVRSESYESTLPARGRGDRYECVTANGVLDAAGVFLRLIAPSAARHLKPICFFRFSKNVERSPQWLIPLPFGGMATSADERPWNIMVDPRVYRGSVVAKKRAEIARINQEIKKIQAEERYRAEVIRNRLNMTLARDTDSLLPDIKSYTTQRYSRIAGPVGRRIRMNYSSVPAGERVRKVGDLPRVGLKKSPKRRSPRLPNLTKISLPLHDPHWIPSGIAHPSKRVEKSTRIHVSGNGIQTTVDFRQVRFLDVGPATHSRKLLPPQEDSPPSSRRKLRSPPPPRRRRSSHSVPPSSPLGRPQFVEAIVQTEEPFDEIVAPLVKEIANTSITCALRSLEEEAVMRRQERERAEIMKILKVQIKENEELSMKIKEEEKRSQRIQAERDKIINDFQAEEGHLLATSLINEVIDSSLRKMLENNMLEDIPKVRSVGADTRSLEEQRIHMELIHAELEKDFFPWMYTRAQKLQEMHQAKLHLKEIIFGKNEKEKAKSKAELKAQLKRLP
uniref:Transmembrane protein 65 n=1 Tax=Steinernema glaseri TaxID=37863 RepID=A0A1I8AFE7_9BILA